METVIPLAGVGFALGWPMEWLVQRFPLGEGTPPSVRRRWVVAALTACLFVPASVIDLNHRIIPNAINLPGAVLVFTVASIAQPDRMAEFLISGILCFLFLGLAWVVYPKGMGLGDVKMALMIGLGTGRYAFVALLAGFMASTFLSAYLLLTRGAEARKATFPFGPFLAFGTEIALLWGPQLSPYLLGGH
jgi:leader peptidase (prepilin peptidase)/N-methyltransferase